jgi:hypothetical protein
MKANYGTSYTVLVGLLTLVTCGLGYLIVLVMKKTWIEEATEKGVSSMNGTHFEWSQLTNRGDFLEIAGTAENGERVIGAVVLLFETGRVVINASIVSNTKEMVLYIAERIR